MNFLHNSSLARALAHALSYHTIGQGQGSELCKRSIAEGAGEYAVDQKARFYRIAKRSATKCAGVLDVCQRLELVEEKRYLKGRELLIGIVSMLIKMAQRQR